MPPTATLEDIKAYQQKVEKDKITPDNLPPCPRCSVESIFFKIHAYRERRFLIIIEMLIKAAYCSLVRFKCPGCNKTFTDYPDFAIPHKHYTRPSITGFSASYLESDDMTYQQAVMVDNSAPGYPQSDSTEAPTLAPTTIHRWITTLGRFTQTCRTALHPGASGKPHIKYLPRPCPADYSATQIQNRSPQETACRLPATGDHRRFFSSHLQHLNFHQVGNALCL